MVNWLIFEIWNFRNFINWKFFEFWIILGKNRKWKLNFFLKELCIFYFFIFGLWNLTCDVTAWTILLRVFERTTGSWIGTFNYLQFLFIKGHKLFLHFTGLFIVLKIPENQHRHLVLNEADPRAWLHYRINNVFEVQSYRHLPLFHRCRDSANSQLIQQYDGLLLVSLFVSLARSQCDATTPQREIKQSSTRFNEWQLSDDIHFTHSQTLLLVINQIFSFPRKEHWNIHKRRNLRFIFTFSSHTEYVKRKSIVLIGFLYV